MVHHSNKYVTDVVSWVIAFDRRERKLITLKFSLMRGIRRCIDIVTCDWQVWIATVRSPRIKCERHLPRNFLETLTDLRLNYLCTMNNLIPYFMMVWDIFLRETWASVCEKSPKSALIHELEGFIFSHNQFHNVVQQPSGSECWCTMLFYNCTVQSLLIRAKVRIFVRYIAKHNRSGTACHPKVVHAHVAEFHTCSSDLYKALYDPYAWRACTVRYICGKYNRWLTSEYQHEEKWYCPSKN